MVCVDSKSSRSFPKFWGRFPVQKYSSHEDLALARLCDKCINIGTLCVNNTHTKPGEWHLVYIQIKASVFRVAYEAWNGRKACVVLTSLAVALLSAVDANSPEALKTSG